MKLRLPMIGFLILIMSSLLNVALAKKVRDLRATIEAIKADANLKVGEQLRPVSVTDLRGTSVVIRYDDVNTPTVLYVFTPPCGWCLRNLDNVKTIARTLSGKYRVVGLSLTDTGLAEYVRAHELPFSVYAVSDEVRRLYKLGGTPQTLVVSRDGKVMKNWRGAYQGSLQAEIEKQLDVRLPGLLTPPQQPRVGG